MKIRYVLGGGVGATILAMTIGLGVVGGQNLDKGRELKDKKLELSDKMGIYPPPESRTLKDPASPAHPSPGYEN